MRYLVTGASGMLGRDVAAALEARETTLLSRQELDITDEAAVLAAVAGHDIVINAAAYTRVDEAEVDEAAATAVNGTGAGFLAAAAAKEGAVMVQVSTDYVFDGTATTPYAETTPTNPRSAYGRSKALGERLVTGANGDASYVVRSAWLYGKNGSCFPKTVLRLAAEVDSLPVVADQVGQPTWTADLAAAIVTLLDARPPFGVYHATNAGQASWFDFARSVYRGAGLDPDRVKPVASSILKRAAPRPRFSVLGHDAWTQAGLPPLRPWQDALDDARRHAVLET